MTEKTASVFKPCKERLSTIYDWHAEVAGDL
ncbi:hypothetical protein T01_314 [Trichinella spiralis]|uniref:Uncharacterized protein n=1 Tax=Trichinella spiralis TaxID=6334 RepID=A0A0V0YPW2_TRISP|nr:hypothetical protein T01_314 [Trichinella spiralis]